VNTQLKLYVNPETNVRTVQKLSFEIPTRADGTKWVPIAASVYVVDGAELLFKGSLGVELALEGNFLVLTWDATTETRLGTAPKANYRVDWDIDGVQYTTFFDVNYWALRNPATETDLVRRFTQFADNRPKTSSVLITDVVDDTNFSADSLNNEDGYWIGATIIMKRGYNAGARQLVTGWVKAIARFTIENPFPSAIRKDDQFDILYSWNNELNIAWNDVSGMVLRWASTVNSDRLNLVVDSIDLKRIHLIKTAIMACERLRVAKEDTWDLLRTDLLSQVDSEFNDIKLKVDLDLSGTYTSDDGTRSGQVWRV
jgi:hypothetical protein